MIGLVLRNLVAVAGALWLGIAGAAGALWWDRRPPATPSFSLPVLGFHLRWTAPDSLAAQLSSLRLAEAAAARRALAVQAEQGRIGARLAAIDVVARARIRQRTQTLIEEIPHVVPPAVDRAFPLSVGLVRLHDAAALGLDLSAVPDPAGRPDDAAASLAPGDLAAVVADNYGACLADQRRLSDLQDWVREVAAAR
jgi:hypothetical protein